MNRQQLLAVIDELDQLSRRRALTLEESLRLERAILAEKQTPEAMRERRIAGQRRRADVWRPEQDQIALTLRAQQRTYASIAPHVGRSTDAVAARLRYLREIGEEAGR